MRIAASELQSRVAHYAVNRVEERERLISWQGDRPSTAGIDESARQDKAILARQLIDRFEPNSPSTDAGLPQSTTTDDSATIELSEEQKSTLLILEKLFGAKGLRKRLEGLHYQVNTISIERSQAEQVEQRVGWGVAYDYSRDVYDAEGSAFNVSGTVLTADGRSMNIQFAMLTEREHRSHEEFQLRAGDAALIDPIVLDLAGDGIGFSGQRVRFDLDADGKMDDLASFAADDLLLTLDRNGNGALDDGSELFGPSSGDGYGELALLDDDGNGWLDEDDQAFSKLSLSNLNGTTKLSLSEAGIGALYLGAAATPFSHKAEDGISSIAQVRASSLYLREDGRAGLMQQVDLVT